MTSCFTRFQKISTFINQAFFIFILCWIPSLKCEEMPFIPYQQDTRDDFEIVVNNRILATINGHPISVLDVVKKMDVLFYRQFPQYAYSPEARHEFYTVNWPYVLREIVDKQLILEDAAELKMEISHGDVRQEVEYIFGPNVMFNLEKANLSFDEVFEILKGDILLKRMVYIRVHNKALMKTTPEMVKKAYALYLKENPSEKKFTYSFLTVRGSNEKLVLEASETLSSFLQENPSLLQKESFSLENLKNEVVLPENVTLTVSTTLEQTEHEISPSFLTVLNQTDAQTFSPFSMEKNKKTGVWTSRSFFVKEVEFKEAPPLTSLEKKLKEDVLQQLTQKEMEDYLAHLTEHFDVKNALRKESIPDNFTPFSLLPRKK